MKHTLRLLVILGFITTSLLAAEQQPTVTFYISGVECGSCVYVVQQSISETKGVSDATVVQVIDNYANVVFDPKVVSEHQIAQAVREALGAIDDSIRVARAARSRALENFGFSALYNLGAIPLAMLGFVNPLIAALAMSGSSLVVTLNALRMHGAGKA
ncbi:MAG: hypothetical protein B7Z37_05470 [Verrucomicrobia bacterium 12-59-8]|nr:MAG: hypothetical protein B7Z37_05470 [Verrucomicrobia bacterium 12-59-8]